MTTTLRYKWAVFAAALIFLVCGNFVRAEFYLRPVAQYSLLTDGEVDSSGSVGGGLSLGAAFGRAHRFEVGAELAAARFNGYYKEPTAWSDASFFNHPTAWRKVPATYKISTALATFRYVFAAEEDSWRPYLGAVLGFSYVTISKSNSENSGVSGTAGLGFGVTYRLGRKTCIEAGYRYVLSSATSDIYDTYDFRYNAHVLSLALDQRF
jgi:Outer membrane protein beta-barrel domain